MTDLLTSREVRSGTQEPVDGPVDDLWTDLPANLPGGTQEPQEVPHPQDQPPDLLTSLLRGGQSGGRSGTTRTSRTTAQEVQEVPPTENTQQKGKEMQTNNTTPNSPSRLSVVVGAQYGSEGKGAIAGHLTKPQQRQVVCVRIGGPNAGHTVIGHGPEGPKNPWRLRTVPVAAVTNPDAHLVIAAGSEIDPEVLIHEANLLEEYGYKVWDRLYIDWQATVLTKEHIEIETNNNIHHRIGSTGKGIGAARAARIMREAPIWGPYRDDNTDTLSRASSVETSGLLRAALDEGCHVVIEGTQGYGLGLHAGHYPQCTSNNARSIDFLSMAAINPWQGSVGTFNTYAVARSNPIRVAGNSGPIENETTWGDLGLEPELTTVTRKVRRVGLWDSELVRDAVRANGGTPNVKIALTMLDHKFPETAHYTGPIQGLPRTALDWIEEIEQDTGATVTMAGTGPDTMTGAW